MRRRGPRGAAERLLGPFFMAAGSLHFVIPRRYEAIVPPYVPRPREVVAISGVAEVAGGLAALRPGCERFTRSWLTALLLAVFPANVHMAVNPEDIEGLDVPRWLLWARLPVQGLLIAWVWRATRR